MSGKTIRLTHPSPMSYATRYLAAFLISYSVHVYVPIIGAMDLVVTTLVIVNLVLWSPQAVLYPYKTSQHKVGYMHSLPDVLCFLW